MIAAVPPFQTRKRVNQIDGERPVTFAIADLRLLKALERAEDLVG